MSRENCVQPLYFSRFRSRWGVRRFEKYATALLIFLACPAARSDAFAVPPPVSKTPRIVSLAPSVTETLFALGAGGHLVGVTSFCDYPDAAKHLPQVGTFMNPSIESLLALKPDLVVAVPERADQESVNRLPGLGLKVAQCQAATS